MAVSRDRRRCDRTVAARTAATVRSRITVEDFRPRGVAGVTTLSNGQIVLILDMKELLADLGQQGDGDRRALRALELA